MPAHHGEVGEVDWLAVEIRPAAAVATDLQSTANSALTCGSVAYRSSASAHSPSADGFPMAASGGWRVSSLAPRCVRQPCDGPRLFTAEVVHEFRK